MAGTATMADVAQHAGVSITTVSHALNGTRHVAAETIASVQRAVEETGYRRNHTARALATSTTTTIGLAMSIITNPHFGELAHCLEDRLRQAGFSLVLANTNDDPVQALDVVADLRARQVAGMFVVPMEGNRELDDVFARMAADHDPLVFLDRRSALAVDQVFSDGDQATFDLVEHLALRGHRRIAFVAGHPGQSSSQDRMTGFLRAVQQFDLDPDPELLLPGDSDERVAQTVTRRHLGSSEPASALVVSNNKMAIGSIRALRELGLAVPEDIAVVSIDQFEGADLLHPGLTAVTQDVDAMAASAVRLLLRRIAEPARPVESVVVPTHFQHRGSCGCRPS